MNCLSGRVLGRWVPLAAVIALLAAAMLAAAFANPTIEKVPVAVRPTRTFAESQPEVQPSVLVETTSALAPDAGTLLPPWVGWLVSALCAVGVLVVVATLLWLLFRDRLAARRSPLTLETAAPPTIAESQQRVRAAVEAGLADLDDADADPRRVVIACWVRLERAAAAAGTPRETGDTSTDLVARLLATHLVSGEVLGTFAEVYREARFATHAVDPAMREQARSALGQLRDELAVGVR